MHPFFKKILTRLRDERQKKKKVVLQDFLFRDAWAIGLYLWPHFSFRSVAVLHRLDPLVRSLKEWEWATLGRDGVLNELQSSLTRMLPSFHMALSLNQTLNAALQQRKAQQGTNSLLLQAPRDSPWGRSCWAEPEPRRGGAVGEKRKRNSAALLPPAARQTTGTDPKNPLFDRLFARLVLPGL